VLVHSTLTLAAERLGTHRIRRVLVAIVIAAGVAGLDVPLLAAAPAPKITLVSGISCPVPTACRAVGASSRGGVVLTSTDRGASWHAEYWNAAFTFSAIACPKPTICFADRGFSPALASSTDGVRSWTIRAAPAGVAVLGDISCASATTCWAAGATTSSHGVVDEAIVATHNGGKSWARESIPGVSDGMGDYAAVSCESATACVFAGYGVLTTDNGGASWISRAVPTSALPSVAVACRSTLCVSLGYSESAIPSYASADILISRDAGEKWSTSVRRVPSVSDLYGVSCPSTTVCEAVGTGYTPTERRRTPAPTSLWPALFRTTNGGSSWIRQVGPSSAADLDSVVCLSPSRCIAVGSTSSSLGAVLITGDGGATWHLGTLP
jgi:photosystem II stability/assembly factor-like uncharacterized protein